MTFDVAPQEFVTLIGPSGCGKSTLLYIVGGLVPATRGEIRVRDDRVIGPSPERGMVFQEFALFPWLTVEQNIAFGLTLGASKTRDRREVQARVSALLDLVGLGQFRLHTPAELSGGMKQRVAIARSLATDPAVLLMDEPFGSLDSQTRTGMQRELLRLHRATKKTILFVTHDIREAIVLSDRVIVLTARPGRVKAVIDVRLPREEREGSGRFSPALVGLEERLADLLDTEQRQANVPV